jgi:hypothetical protein
MDAPVRSNRNDVVAAGFTTFTSYDVRIARIANDSGGACLLSADEGQMWRHENAAFS